MSAPRSVRIAVVAGLAGLLGLLLSACAVVPPAAHGVEFVLVRHAEKADDGTRDPPLTAAGREQARKRHGALADAPLVAAYASDYRRTQQTAQPTADAHRLAVAGYDPARPAAEFAAQLLQRHPNGSVLVVGHSNTVPGLAAALCRCTVAPLGDQDYDRLFRIGVDAQGHALLSEQRYGD